MGGFSIDVAQIVALFLESIFYGEKYFAYGTAIYLKRHLLQEYIWYPLACACVL